MLLAKEGFANPFDDSVIVCLARFHHCRVHLAVARGDAVVGGALEYRELLGLLRDFGNCLHCSGTSADHRNALVGEINALVRETAGVIPLALKFFQAPDLRHVGGRKAANGRNEVARRNVFAAVKMNRPALGLFIKFRARHARAKLDVALEVEPFGNMLQIAQYFRLLRVPLGPIPLLKQFLVKREAVNIGVRIAPRARVAVPVPGSAHRVACFIDPNLQAQPVAQRLQHVHAGKSGADDDRIKLGQRICILLGSRHICLLFRSSRCGKLYHSMSGHAQGLEGIGLFFE